MAIIFKKKPAGGESSIPKVSKVGGSAPNPGKEDPQITRGVRRDKEGDRTGKGDVLKEHG